MKFQEFTLIIFVCFPRPKIEIFEIFGIQPKYDLWLIAHVFFQVKGQEIDGEIKKGAPVFIILTDGEARDKDKRREEVIQKYRSMSRMQIAVGVGSNFNRDELERISNQNPHIFLQIFLWRSFFHVTAKSHLERFQFRS